MIDIPLWISEDEWRLVYTWLYSDDVETAKRGCARVQAWKARSTRPAIPFPLENTAELVECRVSEATAKNSGPLLQQAYAMAVTRFVNGVYEYRYDQCKEKEAVYVALHAMSVPSWVVALRHSATHATMPSLTLLKSATQFALKWLKENYWDKQASLISIVQQGDASSKATRSLAYINKILKEHWENISKAVIKANTGRKQIKKLPKVINNITSKLAALSKKDLTELIHTGSFLIPKPSQFQTVLHMFQLEDPPKDQVETFPILLKAICLAWSPALHLMHKCNPSCISTIMTVLAEGVHETSLSYFMSSYMAAWLGELFSDQYLDITNEVDWQELLTVSYSRPGAYSYAIMKKTGERLSALNHPFVFSDQFSLLLESTQLLSMAERILPTLKPKGSYTFAPQDDYAVNINKLIEEMEVKSSKSDTTNPWKKAMVKALVDWAHVPLGLAPFQTITGTTLELPAQLDSEPTDSAHTDDEQFAPRLGTSVISSPLFESTITRKRKFDQTDLAKIHTYSDTITKI